MPRAPSNENEGRSLVGGIGLPGSKPIKVRDLDDVHTATWGGFRKPKKRPPERTAGGGTSEIPRREAGNVFKATGAVFGFWVLFFGGLALAVFLVSRLTSGPIALEVDDVRPRRCEVVDGSAVYRGELLADQMLEREPTYIRAEKATVLVRFYNDKGERIGEQVDLIYSPFASPSDPVVSAELQGVGDIGFITCEVTADLT